MKKNVGNLDRILRILIAAVIAVLFFSHLISGTLAIVLMALAGIFLVTAFIGVCPIYLALGMKTTQKKTETA